MADGEDVYHVADDFVHDAIGFDDQLVKSFGIRWHGVETLKRNIGARERKTSEFVGGFTQFDFPTKAVVGIEFYCDAENDVFEKHLGVRRPFYGIHTATPACFIAISFLCSRSNTTSFGMPLPSANSRREISTSRESSMLSISASKSVASTRSDVARQFCVMRIGRCVSRGRLMYDEKFWRHSEKGTTSSDGRQRLIGSSAVIGMGCNPFTGKYCTKCCANRPREAA